MLPIRPRSNDLQSRLCQPSIRQLQNTRASLINTNICTPPNQPPDTSSPNPTQPNPPCLPLHHHLSNFPSSPLSPQSYVCRSSSKHPLPFPDTYISQIRSSRESMLILLSSKLRHPPPLPPHSAIQYFKLYTAQDPPSRAHHQYKRLLRHDRRFLLPHVPTRSHKDGTPASIPRDYCFGFGLETFFHHRGLSRGFSLDGGRETRQLSRVDENEGWLGECCERCSTIAALRLYIGSRPFERREAGVVPNSQQMETRNDGEQDDAAPVEKVEPAGATPIIDYLYGLSCLSPARKDVEMLLLNTLQIIVQVEKLAGMHMLGKCSCLSDYLMLTWRYLRIYPRLYARALSKTNLVYHYVL